MAIKTLDFHRPRLNWSKKSDSLSPRSAHMHRLLPLDRQHPLVGIAWNQFLLNFLRRSSTDLVIPALPRERRVPVFCNQANMCSRMKKIFNPKVYLRMRIDSSRLIFKFCLGNFPTGYATIAFVRATSFPFSFEEVCPPAQGTQKDARSVAWLYFFSTVCWYSFNFIFLRPAQIALVSINWGGQISK